MLGASGVVRAYQFVTLSRKQRVELVESLPLALFALMGVALYDGDSHLNIFYQETCNCNRRIVVEKMVKLAGEVRKVVVRMFPWGGRSEQGTPDLHASAP